MVFYKAKKKENEDELHHEYGVIRNIGYILGAFKRYRPSLIVWLLIGGIAGASMSYIWQIISKLVIDMIGQQAALPEKDAMPLLYLVICTTAVEFVMMWLNNLSGKKLDLGFTYMRLMLVQERIAETLSMEYEQLESVEVFAFPISENISMKPSEETDKVLAEKYLRAAGMGDKLDKLPNGMDTELLKVLYDDGVDPFRRRKAEACAGAGAVQGRSGGRKDRGVYFTPTFKLQVLRPYSGVLRLHDKGAWHPRGACS